MTEQLPDRWTRFDRFLQRVQGAIYPEPPTGWHTGLTIQALKWVQGYYPLPPGAKVLDVGCGQGVALEQFAAAGFDATGITLGEDAAVCRSKGYRVLESDFSFLDFPDNSFDLVWCRHALEHSVFPFFTLDEMHRVLKPGGVLYVEVPAPDTVIKHQENPNHYSVFPKSMWTQLILRTGFKQVILRDIPLTMRAGPDMYWAFLQQKAA